MSTLIRNDGAVFLIQVYRDQIRQQKPKHMRESLRHLSAQLGRYVRILSDNQTDTEVAFDKNVGFLLGESMARHFSEHKSFIYVEYMEHLQKSLVVVVRAGKVQLDTLVTTDEVWAELLPLVAGEEKYRLFHYGFEDGLPVELPKNTPAMDSTDEMFAKATPLMHSLFDNLPLHSDLQLIPCERAIKQSNFAGVSNTAWLSLTAVCVLALAAVFLLNRPDEHGLSTMTRLSPYAAYYRGVSEDPASQVLAVVIKAVSQTFQLPAVQLHRIEYSHDQLELDFASEHARLEHLLTWSKRNDFKFALQMSSVKLTQEQYFRPVNLGHKIYSATQIYAFLSDHFRSVHPGSYFRLQSTEKKTRWRILSCEWRVKDLTATDLDWLRRLLLNSPVSCNKITLGYHDGVMGGIIHLKIWGT